RRDSSEPAHHAAGSRRAGRSARQHLIRRRSGQSPVLEGTFAQRPLLLPLRSRLGRADVPINQTSGFPLNPFAALPERLLDAQPALWFGLALLVALMLGEALRRSGRVPAVCAYVAVGLLAGPAGLGLISDDAGIWRQPLIDLAL